MSAGLAEALGGQPSAGAKHYTGLVSDSRQRILIVEDDKKTAEMLQLYLEHAGFECLAVHDGKRGLDRARSGRFDLVVLDLMLPRLDGAAVCRALRAEGELPILMLTARTTTSERIAGLELGADDYVSKPFSPREVVARVQTILRRSRSATSSPACVGGLEVDLDSRRARAGGRELCLTRIEFDILAALLDAQGRVLSRQDLIERALGNDFDGLERTIDAHVMKLRKKIEPDRRRPRYVRTVFGVGYRLGAEDEQQ